MVDQATDYGASAFARDITVPRETRERLECYATLLVEWQTRMNLVGPATLPALWQRHMLDSAQLLPLARPGADAVWADIGTGAGFPGMVLAILGAGHVHLIESIAKKCRFLEAVAKAAGVADQVTIHNCRAEALAGLKVDFITARACAPLERLLPWGYALCGPGTRWWLLKGETAAAEVAQARLRWAFEHRLRQSRSDSRGQIVEAWSVQPRRTA